MTRHWESDGDRQAFFLTKKIHRVIREHNMIEEGDRILVGVSGGKDSMSLLRLLTYWLRYSKVKYTLFCGHVRGDARGSDVDIPESFIRWMENEGAPVTMRDVILPEGEELPMNCERCGRNRRRTLFEMADELGCNKVALGHHLEDFAHTTLLNLFTGAKLETMAFRRDYFDGKFSIIRPLALIREYELVRFAKACEFPVVQADCPKAATSRRLAAKQLMLQVSREFRSANVNLVRAAMDHASADD